MPSRTTSRPRSTTLVLRGRVHRRRPVAFGVEWCSGKQTSLRILYPDLHMFGKLKIRRGLRASGSSGGRRSGGYGLAVSISGRVDSDRSQAARSSVPLARVCGAWSLAIQSTVLLMCPKRPGRRKKPGQGACPRGPNRRHRFHSGTGGAV